MKVAKRLAALLAATLLAAVMCGAGVAGDSGGESAAGGQAAGAALQMDWRGTSAAAWLREAVPEPKTGDEQVLFALLRSGQAAPDEAMVAGYVAARLEALAEAESVEALGKQTLLESAWQMLVLAAAGVDVNAEAPVLVAHFADMEALDAAGADTMRMALLVFGPGGVAPPEGFDTAALARHLAGWRNLDGGYGADGVSDPVTTARMLQALAFYRNDGTVENGVVDVREWLRLKQAAYGGFEVEGSPSAVATAECAVALSCLTETTLQQGAPEPGDALLVFQNEDGAFVPDPDSKPSVELTAQGLLALASIARLEAQMVPVYRMSDVPKPVVEEAVEPPSKLQEEAPIRIPGLPPLSNGVLIAILVGTVALIVLLAALASGGREMRRRKKHRRRMEALRAQGQLPPGVDLDDEDWELDIDYEYVGEEPETADLPEAPDAPGQAPGKPAGQHVPGGRPRRR